MKMGTFKSNKRFINIKVNKVVEPKNPFQLKFFEGHPNLYREIANPEESATTSSAPTTAQTSTNHKEIISPSRVDTVRPTINPTSTKEVDNSVESKSENDG